MLRNTRRPLLLAACALGLTASLAGACSAPATGDDSGVRLDGWVRPDARPDAGPAPDGATTCTGDDLLDQFQCGAGRKCTLTDGTATVGCAPAGYVPAYGGCEPTFPDVCEVGYLCSDQAGGYQCLGFCSAPGSFCEGGRCGDTAIYDQGGVTIYLCLPADGCDAVTLDPLLSGCGPGQACYVAPVGAGMTFCEPEGAATNGEACTGDYDCVQGYACFGPPGGDRFCHKVCRKETDTDCPGAQSCGPLNETYGLCF